MIYNDKYVIINFSSFIDYCPDAPTAGQGFNKKNFFKD